MAQRSVERCRKNCGYLRSGQDEAAKAWLSREEESWSAHHERLKTTGKHGSRPGHCEDQWRRMIRE